MFNLAKIVIQNAKTFETHHDGTDVDIYTFTVFTVMECIK